MIEGRAEELEPAADTDELAKAAEQLGLVDGEEPSAQVSATRPEADATAGAAQDGTGPKTRARRRRADAGTIKATPRDLELLRFIGEQYAVSLPQLARLMGRSEHAAVWLRKRWQRAGWAEGRALLVGQPVFLWPTREGLRLAGLDLKPYVPSPAKLPHIAAVNEVRLYVVERSPASEWTCERRLAQERENRAEHLPDAVVHTAGERHAVEVELTQKASRRMAPTLDALSARFDAVLFFCSPPVRRQLEDLAATGRWPKLAVRDLPEPVAPP